MPPVTPRRTSRSSCPSRRAERRTRCRGIVADKLRQKWNQTIIIENRSGAGGNIGAEAVASSAADGYTLLASPPGPIAINQTLYKKLSFKPDDLMPITLHRHRAERARCAARFSRQDRQGADRLRQGQSRQGLVRFARQRNDIASHRDPVPEADRQQDGACSLSRHDACTAGHHGQHGRHLLRQSRLVHEPACRRQAAHPRRLRSRTSAAAARRADGARIRRARFRFGDLVCADGAKGHAGGDRGQAQCGGHGNPARSRTSRRNSPSSAFSRRR